MKKYLAEFLGTAVLVAVGCGTAAACTLAQAAGTMDQGGAYALIGAGFGTAIIIIAYSVGRISGGHVNPAVSLGVLINGGISFKDFIGYVVSQFLGSILGAAVVLAFFGKESGLGTNNAAAGGAGLSLFVEIVLTFLFVLAVLGATSKKEDSTAAGIIIALALAGVVVLGLPLTGTSVNPARSFGPLLLEGNLGIYWIFFIGPLIGGALAGFCWKALK